MTTTTSDPVLRVRLIQASAALIEARTALSHSGCEDPSLHAETYCVLEGALKAERLLEPVPCTRGHGWWREGGESAACPGCRIAELEASARGEIAPGVWPLDMP